VTTTYSVNCYSITRTATVTISSNPPTVSMSANPTSLIYGNSATLSWSSTNATSCTNVVDQHTGQAYATNGATSGSVSVTPSASASSNRTYSITCSGSGGSIGTQVTITTQHGAGVQLYVNPSSIQTGNSASLAWSSQYATSCTGTNFSTGGATSGNVSVSPTQTTTYSVTCTGNQGSTASDSKVLGVNAPPIGVSCSVNPSPGRVNQPVTWFASAWGGTSPYSYSWIGDLLTGLTGSSVQATYDSPGSKNAIVEVTDSSSTGASGWASASYDNQRCTGPAIDSDSFTQDGGTTGNASGVAKSWARSKINDPNFGPADFHVNPQNYCMQAHTAQGCNPNGTGFGAGTCPHSVEVSLHSGNGRRATNSSDYQVVNGWTVDKYWGVVIYDGTQTSSSAQTVSYQCPVLTVNPPDAPTATLSANPISVVQGSSSTLTWSSTNATSCSIDHGVGSVTPNTTGTSSVTPAATTLYTLTCNGTGGTATAAVTVSVTTTPEDPEDPDDPGPLLSCAVSSQSVNVGQSVTYTASGASAPYIWTPADGVGSYGTGDTANRTFTGVGSFGMTVSKSGYTSGNCPVVAVGPVACGTADVTITASPNRVREGQTSTISWTASKVDSSCTITGPGVSQALGTSCALQSGQATPTISKQSVYTIRCDDGEASAQAIVNLIPKFIEF
jgi:hypothetical protein